MKRYKILHVAPTPLVDSPRKISDAINLYTDFESSSFIFNDYPGSLKGVFSSNTLLYSAKKELAISLIEGADIIHIHNFLYPEQEDIIFEHSRDDVKYIYQVHSPLREGPNFVHYEPTKIEFEKKCAVAQYHPRMYPDNEFVPNIILENPSINLIDDTQQVRVLFSPAHKRTGGRWNDKYSEKMIDALNSLRHLDKIELLIAENYTPHELFQLRKTCHISIDEIVTGAFHQISLEALMAGNVVINNADVFSQMVFDLLVGNDKHDIPFFQVNEFNVKDRLLQLVMDRELIRAYQERSYEYSQKFLQPQNLVKHYTKIYEGIIDAF